MKKVIMIIAVAAILVGCKGKGTRVQISDSVDKFKVETDGRIEFPSHMRKSTFHNPIDGETQKWFYIGDLFPKEGGEQ